MADESRMYASRVCPYCSVELDPLPSRSRKCPSCRQAIVVRVRDGVRVLLTPEGDVAARAAYQAAWIERERHKKMERAESRLDSYADYFHVSRDRAERVIRSAEPPDWATLFGGGRDGGRAAAQLGLAVAALACASEDHAQEARLTEAVAREVDQDEPPTYLMAWGQLTEACQHLLDAASADRRRECAERLRQVTLDGIAATMHWYGHGDDRLAVALGQAEEILGLPPSDGVLDMQRRMRARSVRAELSGDDRTFFQKHKDGIVAVWGRDEQEWWHRHYLEVYGNEPPEGWWTGSQIAPDRMREFGYFDPATMKVYFREMEDRYRAESGLPKRGEGWVTQTFLANCVTAVLPGHEVLKEASPDWLRPQRLDIYVPSVALAIEYQGEQHYAAIDHWGGEQGLADRQQMDARKRDACQRAGVVLIEWRYDEPVSVEAVLARLQQAVLARLQQAAPPH